MQGLASFLDCIAHYNEQDAFYTVKILVFLVRKTNFKQRVWIGITVNNNKEFRNGK